MGKPRKTRKVRRLRKLKKTRSIRQYGGAKCRMDKYNCPYEEELSNREEGEIIPHMLAKEIVNEWCKQGGCVEKSTDTDEDSFYLHCTMARDSDHHIHLFVDRDAYLYKRNGYHNDAYEKGYSLVRKGQFCLEKGASYKWDYSTWVDFLYRRQCQDTTDGSCA